MYIERAQEIAKEYNGMLDLSPVFEKGFMFSIIINDTRAILKLDNIEPLQMELMKTAIEQQSELCFSVPSVFASGEDFFIAEEVSGMLLNDLYDTKPEKALQICKDIAEDYKKILSTIPFETDYMNTGKESIHKRIEKWSKNLLLENLVTQEHIQMLEDNLIHSVDTADSLGYSHGNIIGHHVMIEATEPYLFDLHAVLVPGYQYYDTLRALDFYFLKTTDISSAIALINQELDALVEQYGDIVRTVFAMRCIGILGWDILETHKDKRETFQDKIEPLLQWIHISE